VTKKSNSDRKAKVPPINWQQKNLNDSDNKSDNQPVVKKTATIQQSSNSQPAATKKGTMTRAATIIRRQKT